VKFPLWFVAIRGLKEHESGCVGLTRPQFYLLLGLGWLLLLQCCPVQCVHGLHPGLILRKCWLQPHPCHPPACKRPCVFNGPPAQQPGCGHPL
jgi:hypothetical protein